MKHIFFIPVKTQSERVPGKNFKPVPQFNNAPLYQVLPTKIDSVCQQMGLNYTIVMDTDSQQVMKWASDNPPFNPEGNIRSKFVRTGVTYQPRAPHLCSNSANGNYILREAVAKYAKTAVIQPSDVIWQAFVTTPLLSIETITKIIDLMNNPRKYVSSVLTVESHRGFFWDSHKTPIGGYRPEVMLPTQEMPPIYKEIHGMFGITYHEFLRLGCRTGRCPTFVEVPKEECVDIDWPSDLEKLQQVHRTTGPVHTEVCPIEPLQFSAQVTPAQLSNEFTVEERDPCNRHPTTSTEPLHPDLKSFLDAIESWRKQITPQPTPVTGDPNDPR